MGTVFSELSTSARAAGVSFRSRTRVNTLGAAAAPLVFGVLLLPAVGPKLALLLVVAGYLALSLRAWRSLDWWATAAAAALLAALAPRLAFVDVPEGDASLSTRKGRWPR